jgi:hypothetical protein
MWLRHCLSRLSGCLKRQDLASFVRDDKIIQPILAGYSYRLFNFPLGYVFLCVLLVDEKEGWWQ